MIKTKTKLKVKRSFRVNIRSRHSTHDPLRTTLSRLPFRSIVRLGSTTELNDGKRRVECNSVQAVRNSSNKLLMKTKFKENGVITPDWWVYSQGQFRKFNSTDASAVTPIESLPLPIVAKHIYGSRNSGNTLIKTLEELKSYMVNKNHSNYIYERYFGAVREYRLHINEDECFYTCRKMLKEDTPEDHRWYRNDSNCVWIKEDNALFNKPSSWNDIVEESIKALKAVGLDVGAVDVKVKGNGVDFKILEINSAPSFGDITLEKYSEVIPKILKSKLYA